MANLKDISTVPELKSLEGTEKVLLNVDGSARQVQVDLIKPKTTRELVYEVDFTVEDEVYEIYQNVNEDMTWLAAPTEDSHYEIIVSAYGGYWDGEAGEPVVDASKTMTFTFNHSSCQAVNAEGFGVNSGNFARDEKYYECQDPTSGFNYFACICWSAQTGVHYDEAEDEFTSVDIGGLFYAFSDENGPIKSIKIYKITK